MSNASSTFEDTFVFSADVGDDEHRQRSVSIAFFANIAPKPRQLADRLRDLFTKVPTTEELWIVAPQSLRDDAVSLGQDPELRTRTGQSAALSCVRIVLFDGHGAWDEVHTDRPSDLPVATTAPSVMQAGMRRLFKDGKALDTAHAGLHYRKPSGSHSSHFLRAGPAVQRSPHAHFVAAALLGWADTVDFERIWVDTGAIAGVAYALSELRHRLLDVPLVAVDSFGGYDGLKAASFSTPAVALVSATTSGGLSAEIAGQNLPLARQRTLFYVSKNPADDSILCDMTDREDGRHPELVHPFESWEESECVPCNNGQNVIQLAGDSFIPDAGVATPIVLKSIYADAEHRAFIASVFGKGVIRLNTSDEAAPESTVRGVSLHLGELIAEDSDFGRDIDERLGQELPFRTRYLIHLDDPTSRALAERARALCAKRGLGPEHISVMSATSLHDAEPLTDGVSVIFAGYAATGHELLNVSRELRSLVEGGGDIAYVIGCVRPEGSGLWRTTESSLTFRSKTADDTRGPYPLVPMWRIDMESNTLLTNPWELELRVLRLLGGKAQTADATEIVRIVNTRINELQAPLGDRSGFLPSNYGTSGMALPMTLNPNFAFWEPEIGDMTTASHAEVYFTISSVLHRARHSKDAKFSLFEQPGFGHVLSPANFDRFNDPVIQAAILRGARGTELHFDNLEQQSQHMASVIETALRSWSNEDRGASALEYALSLVRGIEKIGAGALRLHVGDIPTIERAAKAVDAEEAPLLHAALSHYLSHGGA